MRDSLSEKSMSDYVPCCLSTHTISIKNVVPDSGAYVVRCSLRLRLFTVLFALVATRHFGVLGKGGTWVLDVRGIRVGMGWKQWGIEVQVQSARWKSDENSAN
jgi:hypothetical protein